MGCRFMFVVSGIVGWRWRGEGEEGGVASGGMGVGGGRELFSDRRSGGEGRAQYRVGFIRAVDDGRGGAVVGFRFAGLGVGRIG